VSDPTPETAPVSFQQLFQQEAAATPGGAAQDGPDAVALPVVLNLPWWLTETPKARQKRPWPRDANASPHRVKLAHGCMLRYHARYRERRPDPSGPEAIVGKLVHGAYEDAAVRRLAKDRRGIPGTASVDEILHLLEHQPVQLAAEKDDSAGRVTAAMHDEARKIVASGGALDLRWAWAAEHLWTLRLSPSLNVGGRIDRIDLMGDRDDPSEVVIRDYKTSQELPEDEDLWYDPQPGLYLTWARARWPRARTVSFVIQNPRHDGAETRPIRWSAGLEQFHRSYALAAHHLMSSGDKTANPGESCRYCPYRDGDMQWKPCKAYQDKLDETRIAQGGELQAMELKDLLLTYRRSAVASDLHDSRKSEARQAILQKLGRLTRYRHGDLLAYTTQDRLRCFDNPADMVKALADAAAVAPDLLLGDLFEVRRGKLDQWVASLPEEVRTKVSVVLESFQTLAMKSQKLTVRRVQSMF
jgi:hypothetical protein